MTSCLRIMLGCVVLISSAAHAGALITISPSTPGPYLGGETLTIEVYVTTDQTIQPRLFGFDFSQTDPMIQLRGLDGPDLDDTEEFFFDFGTIGIPLYAIFPNFPVPQAVYTSTVPSPGFIRTMTSGVPYFAGFAMIRLPTEPGAYTLDAANYLAENPDYGARIDFDFTLTQTWSTVADGHVEIQGGQYEFTVIPEPATLLMLGIGGVVAICSRRCGR